MPSDLKTRYLHERNDSFFKFIFSNCILEKYLIVKNLQKNFVLFQI
jgi:hypothetical protein